MIPEPIPLIQVSLETGKIKNALEVAKWLRRNSESWKRIEDIAQLRKATCMETMEMLALTLGLLLEAERRAAIEREARTPTRIIVIDPFANP